MKEKLIEYLNKTAVAGGIDLSSMKLEYPEDMEHGDFSSNIALINSKKLGVAPKVLAEKIVSELKENMPEFLRDISVAGPGFINFYIKDEAIANDILNAKNRGRISNSKSKILIEYTDPNTFKVFHIGHLMSNAIGESISRLIEYSGTKVVRICYPSDIGLHIAKSIWAMQKHSDDIPSEEATIQEKTDFLGKMYVEGTNSYDIDAKAKEEIDSLNILIYKKSNEKVNELYTKGRRWSLEHFELLYKQLGTKFDDYIYESEMAEVGLDIVKDFLKKEVFEMSDGATVFKGEKYGLHTRVFINSHDLPTYEAKDVGLNVTKFRKYPDADQSIIITASEQNDYFKVLTKVLTLIDSENGTKTKHIGHGMMRFASGKMSSRTGKVITAEALISDIKGLVKEKIIDRDFTKLESEEISNIIAIGAIKYSILRTSVGSDIIFDSKASISFEGDSGPYLQYSVVRANSVLEKVGETKLLNNLNIKQLKNEEIILPEKVGILEKLISRFPDIVERAKGDLAPQIIANYLTTLAGAFNSFYASQIILDSNNKFSPYYIASTKIFRDTMKDGLWILGIEVPNKM